MFFTANITIVLALIALAAGAALALLAKAHKDISTGLFSLIGYIIIVLSIIMILFAGYNMKRNCIMKKKFSGLMHRIMRQHNMKMQQNMLTPQMKGKPMMRGASQMPMMPSQQPRLQSQPQMIQQPAPVSTPEIALPKTQMQPGQTVVSPKPVVQQSALQDTQQLQSTNSSLS